jgi:hypothetical protein
MIHRKILTCRSLAVPCKVLLLSETIVDNMMQVKRLTDRAGKDLNLRLPESESGTLSTELHALSNKI